MQLIKLNWYDCKLENNLNKISQTVFNVIIENAKKLTAFTNNYPLVYIENSKKHRNDVKNQLLKL
jgi:hypothetical protein